MPKEKMLWACDGLSSVRSSKLREFRVEEWNTFDGKHFRLAGYYNKTDSFFFGMFNTTKEAKVYLEGIHKIIEGRK